ncbi:MAG: acyl carrier protein [Dehalococcoidia bacterium]|nr:acyl carrier protein [Dehalococcoidia bacterium]
MASTEDRIRTLLAENLEVDGKPLPQPVDFSMGLTDVGVSSMDVVAFAKVIAQEFDVEFTPEICAGLDTLNDLVKCLEGQMS